MANPAPASQEPTMEEILASIRRIISEDSNETKAEDKAPEAMEPEMPGEPEEDVLELTQFAPAPLPEPQPVVVTPPPQPMPPPQAAVPPTPPPAPPEPKPAPQPAFQAAPKLQPVAQMPDEEDDLMLVDREEERSLVSTTASQKAMSAFGNLAQNMRIASIDSRTIEDVVHDLLRPMLKDWLERNLPDTVERLVQEEIDRMAKRTRR